MYVSMWYVCLDYTNQIVLLGRFRRDRLFVPAVRLVQQGQLAPVVLHCLFHLFHLVVQLVRANRLHL